VQSPGRRIAAGLAALILAALLVGNLIWGGAADNAISTHTVARGEFRVSHFESGEVWATKNERIDSPRVGGRLMIVHMWPEGERVEVGDLIPQYDRTNLRTS